MLLFRTLVAIALALKIIGAYGANAWHPVAGNLVSRWAKDVDPNGPLPEYPRPQMVRSRWQNLNGLWQYTITNRDLAPPSLYSGEILVPFPIESALSGVKKALLPDQNLWYRRTFVEPHLKRHEHLLLHFGAVDYEAVVFVNGMEVGHHVGGYQEFSFDITRALKKGTNEIVVKVWDPTDQGPNPHGKQSLHPEGIFYTASSGIWQTVWLEPVAENAIEALSLKPNVDGETLEISVLGANAAGYRLEVSSGQFKASGLSTEPLTLKIPHPHLWSPEDPYLYDLNVRLLKGDMVVDEVQSYFGMRKLEVKADDNAHFRIYLNDRYTYNLGVLDQGYWPDGLYTAPTDAALRSDIETIKSMGFNTIRKHIKIEPARWYYYCDRLGMMVWQDMAPPGDFMERFRHPGLGISPASQEEFETELGANIAQLQNHPSITTWVLFNEGWGAYDQDRLERRVRDIDGSRLLDGHSGEMILIQNVGPMLTQAGLSGESSHFADIHSYPDPAVFNPIRPSKALILGEFGGIGVSVKDHMWINPDAQDWSYQDIDRKELPKRYQGMLEALRKLETMGLTASIYTQPFDVEAEHNGLVTYDRAAVKIPTEVISNINSEFLAGTQPAKSH
jgi:hypothetical protein